MEVVVKNIIFVILELGGKSFCIIDDCIQLEYMVKCIIWGKFINVGQICVVFDYLLVNKFVKFDLLEKIKQFIDEFYGDNFVNSLDYGWIVNKKEFNRLNDLLKEGKIVIGGEIKLEECYILFIVIEGVNWDLGIMQEEIFGFILFVLEYENLDEVIVFVNFCFKFLFFYFFF